MNTTTSIQRLADARIIEAECLLSNGHYDFAYYIAGYAIEQYLKARIAIILNMPNFFDFENRSKFINEDNITKPYKVHSYYQLLILSGLFPEHERMLNDTNFIEHWATVKVWKEGLRYGEGKPENDTREFINSVKYYSSWIKQYS